MSGKRYGVKKDMFFRNVVKKKTKTTINYLSSTLKYFLLKYFTPLSETNGPLLMSLVKSPSIGVDKGEETG